jgi:hypothetical protein
MDQARAPPPRRPQFAGRNRAGRIPKIFVKPRPVTIWQALKVTKWSTITGELTVSDPKSEQTSGEFGSLGAGPAVPNTSEAQSEPVAAAVQALISVESPDLAPAQSEAGEIPEVNASKADAPKIDVKPDAPKADAPKADAPKVDAPKVDAPKADAPKADAPHIPGRVIMLSGDPTWDRNDAAPEPESEPNSGIFGKRRVSALAAVVALAAITGALGGALATAGLGHLTDNDSRIAGSRALEAQVAQLDADLAAIKASVEHTSKLGMAQFNRTSDRLDKVEKAQLEPAAKIAKLSDAVDKLRAAPAAAAVVAAAPAAAKDVTGSIAPAAAPAPKAEVARLPMVESWVLRDVAHGSALIEGRQGMFEVYAGDAVPGLGRVDAIRRQDGHWVVVTTKGLIVAR